MKTVVGFYDELEDAREAVDELVESGVPRSDISLVASDVTGEYASYIDRDADGEVVGEAAAAGAVGGATVGGLMGLLVGLGAFAIPGLGPIIAAGPVVAALAGAGIGAATGGILGALVEWGIPETEAGYYAEGLRRGGTLLVVRAAENQVEDVTEIMNDYNPVNIERRAEHWRSEYGWERYDPNAEPYAADEIESYRSTLSTWDDRDYDETVDLDDDLLEDDYDTTDLELEDDERFAARTPQQGLIRTYGDGPTQGHVKPRGQGYDDTTHDIQGHVKPREQGYEGDRTTDVRGSVKPRGQGYDDTMRDVQGHVKPDSRPLDPEYGLPVWADLESDYRRNYDTTYATVGRYTWTQYMPAYRYGYDLATDSRYMDRDWADVEMDARRQWEMEHDGAWQEFKDAVRYGWEQVKDALGVDGYDTGVDDQSDEYLHRR